jgi:hypothetical protein
VSDTLKHATEQARDAATKQKDRIEAAAEKAEADVREHTAKTKERLADSTHRPGGRAS